MPNQHKKKKKTGIPERWLDYCPVGQRIPGTRFIAFKVPLQPSLNLQVPESCSFGLWDLLDAVESQKQELGLIIDLTFTTRYYKLTDVPQSCSYIKIFIEGHKVPSDINILSFKRAVRGFLWKNQDNDKLIGVHCTHGLNRTGYLVCRYLIDVDGLDPPAALKLFNASRGHCIERKNYLHDLLRAAKRSNNGIDEPGEEAIRGLAVVRPLLTAKEQQSPTDVQEHQPFSDVTTENKQANEEQLAGNQCRRKAGHHQNANQKSRGKAKEEERQSQSLTDVQEHQPSSDVTTENKANGEQLPGNQCRRRTRHRQKVNQKSRGKAKEEERQSQSPTEVQEHQPSSDVTTEDKQANEEQLPGNQCRRRARHRQRANQKSRGKPALDAPPSP